jgi:uncharacterized membrane protein
MGSRLFRRLAGLMVVPVLVAGLVMAAPQPAQAASGGRIGGGSFRSAPSMPRSYGGGGGGYRGGGMGFPFIVPIFGFGGGGLFGFLILMAVAGVVVNALRGGGGGGPALGGSGSDLAYNPRPDGPVAIAQIQVGLLASARDLQDDLRRLAGSSDTSSSSGLQRVLQETSLSLLRHPDLWVYANGEVGQVPFASAESTFNRLSMQERSKLERELTANVAGRRFSEPATVAPGASDAASDFIVVTLLVASRQRLAIKGARSAEDLRDSLQKLGALGADDLLALEVIWQPEGAGEVLSTEQVITAYPDLQHL